MNKRKWTALALVACMGMSLLAGCSKTEDSLTEDDLNVQSSDESGTWDEEPAEVKWLCWSLGDMPGEQALNQVVEEINKITQEKINVTVDLEFLDMGTYMTQMPMMVTSGEKLDLITTFPAGSGNYATMISQNQLKPLSELLKTDGSGILDTVPEKLMSATSKDGEVYAVPVYQSLNSSTYWMARKAIFEDLGFTEDEVTSLDDIHEVLKACKDKYPDMFALSGNAQNASPDGGEGIFVGEDATEDITYYDALGDSLQIAVVEYNKEGAESKVVNKYETEEYKDMVDMLKTWYDEGLIDKDVANKQDDEPAKNQKAFSWFAVGNNTRIEAYRALAGEDVVAIKLGDSEISTSLCTRLTMAIPTSATEPEAAMRLMNLLYTDEELKNLVNFGIQGVHYELNENNCVTKLESSDGGYNPRCGTIVGNVFLDYYEEGTDPEVVKQDKEAMENALYSPLIGFQFDASAKSEIFAQLGNIYNEYTPGLRCGSAKEGALDEFNQKMKDAGLEEYLQEAQTQLDAWLNQ